MFGNHFKISFSSVTKVLKLKSNAVHDEHTIVLDNNEKENNVNLICESKLKILHTPSRNFSRTANVDRLNRNAKSLRLPSNTNKHLETGGNFISVPFATKNVNSNKSSAAATSYDSSNCKIENCCCKSFFRDYTSIDNFRRRIPLQERSQECTISYQKSSNKNKHFGLSDKYDESYPMSQLEKEEGACKTNILHNTLQQNSVKYCKSLNFEKPKENSKTSVLNNIEKCVSRDKNIGNVRQANNKLTDEYDSKIQTTLNNNTLNLSVYGRNYGTTNNVFMFGANSSSGSNFIFPNTLVNMSKNSTSSPMIKVNTFDVTSRINKKNKIRNLRQIKRLKYRSQNRKNLEKTRTFNGYDNLAYRKSMSEINFLKDNLTNRKDHITENNGIFEQWSENYHSNCNNQDLRSKGRMQCYNWQQDTNVEEIQPYFKSANDFRMVSSKSVLDNNKINDNRKRTTYPSSKLKRHGSFGYFQNDSVDNENILIRRLSLDNLQKVSSSCGVKSIPEDNNKILKQRRSPDVDIHIHALFSAVEHGQVEKAKTILESTEINVNSMNSDGFSPLDVAVLSNNKPLIKVLIAYGAQDGKKFYSADDMRSHLLHLLHESERRVHELGSSLRINEPDHSASSASSSSTNIPCITVSDSIQTKTYSLWERRTKGLRKMLLGFEQIRPPDLPMCVNIEVTSTSSIMVYFQESNNKDSPTATRFKVQWSLHKDFSTIYGHYEIIDPRQLRYHITNLKHSQCYYVRVSCGNLKGYSLYKTSTPSCVIPSSWHDISLKDIRSPNATRINLEDIFNSVVTTHPYLKNNSELYGPGGELLVNQRRKKTTIKQLFTAASKFQKHLRRGVYLSCLLYHEDKVLVTNEDFLPVIEIDETYPKKMHADFHWFFKVAFSWCDLKWLKSDMEKSQNSSAVFRIKLLQAATQMQTALSIQELGKLYHKLIRDREGTIVISVINYIHSPKSVSVLNLRWLPLTKLTKRTNMMNVAESNVGDILMSSIPDQITYHQVSSIRLPRGLYLGYLKMRSSVDQLQILVPCRAPNIPPHCKIRDNPHVTAEEWEWLTKKENLKESLSTASYQQRLFVEQVAVTTRRLFTYMEISEEEATSHRLYDTEVIEVSKDVSLVMILPPTEAACSMPGQRELLLQRPDLLPLTVQVFEMVHFGTYQLDLVSLYSRLSCIIEMDIDLAQHSLRKAFSSIEVSTAKSRLLDLENLHSQLNTAWKPTRWLLDVISYARDRLSASSTSIQCLLSIHPKRMLPTTSSHCFLQPPDPKTAKSRGSWPGVGVGRHLGRIPSEMSRSEQHLTSDSMNPQTTTAVIKPLAKPEQPSRSQFSFQESNSSLNRIIPAQSEDLQLPRECSARVTSNIQGSNSDSITSSQISVSSNESSSIKVPEIDEGITVPIPTPAIVQVHAAYNTGLPCGTSLKLHVSPKTSAREIVELFVKQLNMSVLLKGKDGPVYPTDQFPKFCLVAVIGARERCLRDDFKLLQLQEPWKDGRLYVRRKSDVLAAIEHSSKQSSTFVNLQEKFERIVQAVLADDFSEEEPVYFEDEFEENDLGLKEVERRGISFSEQSVGSRIFSSERTMSSLPVNHPITMPSKTK